MLLVNRDTVKAFVLMPLWHHVTIIAVDKLIQNYEIQLVEPACGVGSARWGAQVSLTNDISAVFPYLNAILDNARYDHQNQVLIWEEQSQKYALRPGEIKVAEVNDPQQARQIVSGLVDKVNRVWQDRDNITPRFTERRRPAVIEIFKLLPQTNCKECGYPTCMAFAAALSKSTTQLDQCPPLSQPEYAANREKLLSLLSLD